MKIMGDTEKISMTQLSNTSQKKKKNVSKKLTTKEKPMVQIMSEHRLWDQNVWSQIITNSAPYKLYYLGEAT